MPSLFKGDWSIASDPCIMPLADLQDASIGVEASYYLYTLMNQTPAHEPLLAALGGEPMGLRVCIEKELDKWKDNRMKPIFVFEGQSVVGKDKILLKEAKTALSKTENAWNRYTDGDSMGAVKLFGSSGAERVTDFYPILQSVLEERGLDYIVAPFSACAQLAYLEGLPEPIIDGIMGSQELLLYEISDAIITPPLPADWDKKALSGISKHDLIRKFGVNAEMFSDALLMLGTSFLGPCPPLQDSTIITNQPYQMRDAINLLRTSERSVTSMCTTFHDVIQVRDRNWLDNYRKAKMGIEHCIVVAGNGSFRLKDDSSLTIDNHEYLGLQLPSEIYHYLTQAVVGTRLMNLFDHLEILVFPTLDGVLSDEYKKLVTTQLVPFREQTVGLILPLIHRGFKFGRIITTRYWFDESLEQKMQLRSMGEPDPQIDTWGVRASELNRQAKTTKTVPGTFSFALLALEDKEFPPKTIHSGEERISNLTPNEEALPNALWRLLYIRGYINAKHELTPWGTALKTTLKALRPIVEKFGEVHHIEEAAFLAYELIRLDNLNTRNQHRNLIGGALRGSEEDKNNCMLIGRTACLLKLRHKTNGYTGPLSKVFLAYHSIIKAVREADRDLLEGAILVMLLGNQINRENDDFKALGHSLPFLTDIDIGLGIAVKTFLDDVVKPEMSAEEKQNCKINYAPQQDDANPDGRGLLPLSVNFPEDLDVAFKFFDALHEGVKTLGNEVDASDKRAWDAAKQYLDRRR